MSYILDALRKSDQLRQQNAAPTLLLGQATAAPARQPAPLFLYGGLAFILLAAGVAIGWLRPWQAEPVASMPTTALPQKSGPAPAFAPQPDKASKPAPTAHTSAQPAAAPASARKVAPAVASVPAPKPAVKRATPQPATSDVSRRAVVAAPAGSSDRSALSAAPVSNVTAMADLPLAIQQELPPMSISVHAYSSRPAERLVGINNRLLHEGDEAAPGLKLLEITPNGMILSYRGYNFRRGVR